MTLYRISFAGAGRVAAALCRRLSEAGHTIDLIVSRSEESCSMLAKECGCSWSTVPHFPESSDLVIVSVPDHSIAQLLGNIRCGKSTTIAHTAGSIDLSVFPGSLPRYGVLYPLQTFSAGRKINFSEVPFFIEASDRTSLDLLKDIALSTGGKAFEADSEYRRMLHVAAVFVCNFTNHMYDSGNEIAGKAGFDFNILMPLISETISKAADMGPEAAQTGPALRHDLNTIEKHLDLLSFSPRLQSVYRELTRSITERYNKE